MQEKAPIPVDLLDRTKSSPIIEAWFEIAHLKQLYRQGWLKRGISTDVCETVAEHTFGNAVLCLLLLPQHPELDASRVLRMAVVHDLAEAYVGDLTPHDNVAKHEKSRRETEAIEKILGKLPQGGSLLDDWHEYEAQETPEARFVKQIDRLELALQASVYAHQGLIDPTEFYEAARKTASEPSVLSILEALRHLSE